ncbi:hypothetical protein PF008_g10355 [Phytophthora fragariae]|uniref:Uncharacterized protein n=1 Tax=Phytophthora fragariae TaxID=53985 RepID=A0A6G0RVG6_9STRA|nr:hypothetical protein PF008_g10355 [Phytophthora fragariae]
MNSQREWNALETKYATPPVPEDRRAKTRRKANRAQARSRLQKRQVRRRIEAQEAAAVAVGALPHVELTQAEEAVLARRYSTPPIEESADARRLRLNNRRRAEVKLPRRSTSRRLQITTDAPDPAHMSEAVESFAVGDHALPGTTASAVPIPSVVREPPSYEQLAAAVLNLASEAVSTQEDGNELPTRTQLITALRNLTPDDADSTGLPTYEDLAAALRTFAPTESRQNDVGRDGPTYAQLNAALRNLSPGLLSQDQPADGFPTYTQLSEALRNLTPTPSSATDNLSGFPTYAQLAEALRRLPSETAPVRSSRHSGGQTRVA